MQDGKLYQHGRLEAISLCPVTFYIEYNIRLLANIVKLENSESQMMRLNGSVHTVHNVSFNIGILECIN